MENSAAPFKRMVFVCTHKREGEGACSNGGEGENLLELLRAIVKERGLKSKIRIAKSGCFDVCAQGPNIIFFNELGQSAWYKKVAPEDIPKLAEIFFKDL